MNFRKNFSVNNLDKINIENIINLTPLQQGMLFHYLKDEASEQYFEQLCLNISGEINQEIFVQAWNLVVKTNEMLRVVFRWEKLNSPVQIILKEHPVEFYYKDLSVEQTNSNSEIEEIKKADRKKGFNLNNVAFRITLVKKDDKKYVLIISNHHIIYDGWSNGIILKEFLNYYNKLVVGDSLKVNKKTSFKNFLKLISKPSIEEKTFWKDYLNGYEVNSVFSAKRNYLSSDKTNECYKHVITEEKVQLLKSYCELHRLTIADILYNAWGILLSKYSGKEDILFGTTVSGRNIKLDGIEKMIGLFINTIPLRISLPSDKSLFEIIKENANQLRKRVSFENVPLHDILNDSAYKGDELFESIFVIENYPLDQKLLQENGTLKFKSFNTRESNNFKLTVGVFLKNEIEINFRYSNTSFEENLIENLGRQYIKIIEFIIHNEISDIQSLSIMSNAEKKKLLYEFNDTKRDYPKDKTIYQLFEEQATWTPDSLALVSGEGQISYSELSKRSNQLAHYIINKGIGCNSVVSLFFDPSLEMLISIIGVLKSGGIYLPINTELPKDRVSYMIRDSGSDIVLTHNQVSLDIISDIDIVDVGEVIIKSNIDELKDKKHESGSAYLIYTSGTTGNPKGVLLSHRNLMNYFIWFKELSKLESTEKTALVTSYSFDLGYTGLYSSIINGSELHLVAKDVYLSTSKFVDYIIRNRISYLKLTSSLYTLLIDDNKFEKAINNLRLLVLGGEEINTEAVKTSISLNSKLQIINHYGPTEATIGCISFGINKYNINQFENRPVIGKPINNINIYILNEYDQMQLFDVPGELCISGDGLALGYLNNPELIADKFIVHPFKEGERLYRTGDLACWLPDGNIEFLGRIDHQVKVRGFRIELEEIENSILNYAKIEKCVVLCREDQGGEKYLCAYIVSQENDIDSTLRAYLSGLLPDYMIPSYFVELDKIPLTSNGKVDRKSLPEPQIKAGEGYVAPQTLIESKLVKIWSGVLNIAYKEISTNINFFELGGHSLKATVLVSQIHKELDVRLELRDIFQYKTIQAQAELINLSEGASYFSIPKAKNKEYYPLSSSQRRLYLLQKMDLGSTAYNMPGLIAVPKGQNKHQIEEVFNKLIARHENFRTSFEVEGELPVQRIHSEVSFSIKDYQITRAELSMVREDFVRAFDLSVAPLLRVAYLEIIDGDDMLLVDMHHIISDGRSHSILEEEFYQLIAGKDLEPLRLQYKDYSEWQNSSEQQERIKGQESYWLDKFSDEFYVLKLPTDYPRPVMQSFEGASVSFILCLEDTKIIAEICKEQGLTMYMLLLSIFTVLLSKLSCQEDIIVGSPIAARCHADLDNVVGMFVNTLALRSKVSGETNLMDYFHLLKGNMLEAYENQEYQFEDLVDKVIRERDPGHNPVFDVVFTYNSLKENSNDIDVYERVNNYEHIKGVSRFDLMLYAFDYGNKVKLCFEYSTKLFKPDTINTFIKYFYNIIDQIVKKKGDLLISDIYLMVNEGVSKTENKDYTNELDDFSF